MLTAQQILNTHVTNASDLFAGDGAAIKATFHKLAKQWHPDHNKSSDAASVFLHLNELRAHALRHSGRGSNPGLVREFVKGDGVTSRIKYVKARSGDTGEIFVTTQSLAIEFVSGFEDVARRFLAAGSSFEFPNDMIRQDIDYSLPKVTRQLDLPGRTLLFVRRPKDMILLADLIEHFGGSIPAVHVAWIGSSLLNLGCYLNWSGLMHGAISPLSVLVCPKDHAVMLADGWGYSTPFGERPAILPRRTVDRVPRIVAKGQVATSSIDTDLIKLTLQQALGSPGGAGLLKDQRVPRPMADWLLSPSSESPNKEYADWKLVLQSAFGPRKYVEMKVSSRDVYTHA